MRFTQSEDGKYVYAFLLKRPSGPVELRSVQPQAGSAVARLGHEGALAWTAGRAGMTIDFPRAAKDALAYTLRIEAGR